MAAPLKPFVVPVAADGGSMDVHLVLPSAPQRRAGILVFQEAFGVNPHILHVCERLAAAGFVAAAPELYHRAGRGLQFGYGDFDKVRPVMSLLTNAQVLGDARAAYELLAARPDVDPRRIVAIGFCLGGFACALAACHLPLAAAASFYGGGMARPRPGMRLAPLLDDFARLGPPVLFSFGDQDQSVSADDVAAVRDRVTAPGRPHQVVVYPGVGHGFMCDERPSFHQTTAEAAWARALAWSETHLAGQPSN